MDLAQTSTPVTYAYVTDRARAVGFYTETLGFAVRNSGEHGDTIDMGRSLLHLTQMADHKPGPHPVVGWEVPDVVAVVEALKARGVAMTVYALERFGAKLAASAQETAGDRPPTRA